MIRSLAAAAGVADTADGAADAAFAIFTFCNDKNTDEQLKNY